MPSKRKDGRYKSSVILENPITVEKVRRISTPTRCRNLRLSDGAS